MLVHVCRLDVGGGTLAEGLAGTGLCSRRAVPIPEGREQSRPGRAQPVKEFTGAAAVAGLAQVSREEEAVRTAEAAWRFLSWVLLPHCDLGNLGDEEGLEYVW